MQTFALYLAVFVSGASVLALEILGTRILGPFYGVSLFLWSALITVTLAALSVGYVVGGRLADRGELEQALAQFRGRPLAEFEGERFAAADAARLEELRLAYLEDRIAADLETGRPGALIGELEALVAEHPLRERLRGQLMLALYRSGRQAEALEAFQTARSALVEELGIEPGRELRDLEQAILRQDPSLDLAAEEAPSHKPPVRAPARRARRPRRPSRSV